MVSLQWILIASLLPLGCTVVAALQMIQGTTTRGQLLTTTRARFLSSFLASSALVWANDPQECAAGVGAVGGAGNPRYIEQELQMQYGENKGAFFVFRARGETTYLSDPSSSSVLLLSIITMSHCSSFYCVHRCFTDGNPRSRGVLVRRLTGDSTPFSFPVKPVKLVKEWPKEPPFNQMDFFRTDSSSDSWFYTVPKLVYHIDEPAVASLTQYYRNNIKPGSDILDICASWVSHYPLEFPETMGKIHATGMNGLELQFNDQLTGGYVARDLNEETALPYEDNSMDVVTCVVSIDYLIKPIEVLKEVHRVLRPGGKVIISQSNRCFPTKAIAMWLSMNDRQHLELINGYFQYAGGFEPRQAYDITAELPDNGYRDPMFIVEAVKSKA